MLTIEHRAFHLYREDAYREYCFSVDVYGAYQPASFIYLCFEAFKDACAKHGLSLVMQATQCEQKDFPWRHERDSISNHIEPRGLILRIQDDKDVTIAQETLRLGRNVLALIPSELLSLFWPGDDELIQKSKSAATKLGVTPGEWEKAIKLSGQDPIHWKEIKTDNLGRLFMTRDAFLSDGYFLESYGFSAENQRELQALIQEFASFKTNLIRLSYRNEVNSWPTGEPLTVLVDAWNHGPDFGGGTLTVDIGSEFEPLSSLERKLPPLRSLERTSFALQLVPRVDGDFPMITGTTVSLEDGSPCIVDSSQLNLSVVPALGSRQHSSVPQDNETLSRLIEVFRNTDLLRDVEPLPRLAEVDTNSCLNKMRIVTERLVFQYIKSHNINCPDRNLNKAITALKNSREFSDKTIGYLHTIRVIGNLASHELPEPCTDVDVRIVSFALASVVEEFLAKKLL